MPSIARRKIAFTIIELLIAVIIVGILAALALPQFTKSIESTKGKEAIAALHQIRTAERTYRIAENTYWNTKAIVADNSAINAQLNLFLDTRANRNWDYIISAGADTFTARARRISGRNTNETITINQDGTINEAGWSP